MFENFLQKIDQFGVHFFFQIRDSDKQFKSYIGGIFTLLIYSMCLAYTIYILTQWGEGNILPKVTTQLQTQPELNIQLPENFMSFYIDTKINPFSQEHNILMPILLHLENGLKVELQPLYPSTQLVSLSNITIGRSETSKIKDKASVFLMIPCNNSYNFNYNCASDQEINDYISKLSNLMTVKVQVKQFNQKENNFGTIDKDSILIIDNQYLLYNQIKLKTTLNQHDQGFLFEDYKSTLYINDRELVSQPIQSKFAEQQYNIYNPLFATLIRVDGIQTVTIIIDAKIGEIFASIGSILSILMSIQLIATMYNSRSLESQLIDEFILFLFPNLNKVKINKNLFGKIITIESNQQLIDQKQFILKYEKYKEIGSEYFNIKNLIQKIRIIEQQLNIPFQSIKEYENNHYIIPQSTVKLKDQQEKEYEQEQEQKQEQEKELFYEQNHLKEIEFIIR